MEGEDRYERVRTEYVEVEDQDCEYASSLLKKYRTSTIKREGDVFSRLYQDSENQNQKKERMRFERDSGFV